MKILAIDPGCANSAWVLDDNGTLTGDLVSNQQLLGLVAAMADKGDTEFAIETLTSYGKRVGIEVFETCIMVGRLFQLLISAGQRVQLIDRKAAMLHLCRKRNGKDSDIRTALIARLGPPGTAKKPGPTHGMKTHLWAALAISETYKTLRRTALATAF